MKTLKLLAVVLALATALAFGGFTALAEGNVTYSGDAGQFIFAPGSDHSATDLFTEYKEVMPGDELVQHITVKNNASKKIKVNVYMRSLGAHRDNDNIEFLSQLDLTVKKLTDTVMFDAKADETAQLTDWVLIGTLYSKSEVDLELILKVPTSLDSKFMNRVGLLDWQFMVEELPLQPGDPGFPQTGDTTNIALYLLPVAGFGALTVVMFIILFRRKKKEEESV